MGILQDNLASHKTTILIISTLAITTTSLLLLAVIRLAQILPLPLPPTTQDDSNNKEPPRPPPSPTNPTHLLIVLGSGGHTAEMLNILHTLPNLTTQFTRRTYVVSSGDSFSAKKAVEFERQQQQEEDASHGIYSVITVRRARRVHQSFLTTPVTTLLSLWDCIAVLRGQHVDFDRVDTIPRLYPDLIMTNGPGTGVCVVLAALLLRFFGYGGGSGSTALGSGIATSRPGREQVFTGRGQMRTIFIESWARVKTLSLSGKILRPLVNRFLVQWPQLAEILGEGVEYIGPLVS